MSFGLMGYGMSASIISTTLGQPSFLNHMGLLTSSNAAGLEGAMNSLYYVGGIFGSFSSSWIANTYGRKWTIFCGCMLMVVGGALLAGSVNPAMFMVFRFVAGAGYVSLLLHRRYFRLTWPLQSLSSLVRYSALDLRNRPS